MLSKKKSESLLDAKIAIAQKRYESLIKKLVSVEVSLKKLFDKKYNRIGLLIVSILLMSPISNASEVSSNIVLENTIESKDLVYKPTNAPMSITVNTYLERRYSIKHGFVCQSKNDILCINDFCGDSEYYWAIILNGNEQNTSINSILAEGDELELVYRSRKESSHENLRKWLSEVER